MRKGLAVLLISLWVASPALAGGRLAGALPAPKLLAPGDDADLSGKEALEFRWTAEGDRSETEYFDLRIYKGHETVEAGLIFKEQVPSGKNAFKVPTTLFEAGQEYAWSVKPVGRKKGRSDYTVFKVIKK